MPADQLSAELRFLRLAHIEKFLVVVHHGFAFTHLHHLPVIEKYRPPTHLLDRPGRVRDEDDRAAVVAEFFQGGVAFALEKLVPNRQRFVDNQHIGRHADLQGKSQTNPHARGIHLHRLIQKISDIGEGGNALEQGGHLIGRHPQDRSVDQHVGPAGFLGIEPRAQFQQSADPALHGQPAHGGLQHTEHQLEQRGFARAVRADNAERFTPVHFKGNVAQGPELAVKLALPKNQSLLQAIDVFFVNVVTLTDVFNNRGDFTGHVA